MADPSGAEGEHYDYNRGGYVNSTGQSVSFSEAMASQGLNTNGSKKSNEGPGPIKRYNDWIFRNFTVNTPNWWPNNFGNVSDVLIVNYCIYHLQKIKYLY